jgi:hypothetical protein
VPYYLTLAAGLHWRHPLPHVHFSPHVSILCSGHEEKTRLREISTEYNPRTAHRDTDLSLFHSSKRYTLRVHWHFHSIQSLLYFPPFLAPHYKLTETVHGTLISFLVLHVVCIGRTHVQDGLSKLHSCALYGTSAIIGLGFVTPFFRTT